MRKVIYALILLLLVISGLVFANRDSKDESSEKLIAKPLTAAEMKAGREAWEATPDGIKFKEWERSPAGKKVYAAENNIRKHIKESTNMEGVVTSLSLPPGSRLGYGIMVQINGFDYILSFGALKHNNNFLNFNDEFQQLHSLKVNDKINIKSGGVSHAPKYAYPILSGQHVERDGKEIFKRAPQKGGC